ncbi:MAG: HIT domain-containing protein [Clostridia bacterium]|nr:HIT domain-containing protein [Clostridia bacterium]
MLGKILFRIAKAPLMGKAVASAFRYFGWAVPVRKVYSDRMIAAFHHPRPSYQNHIVIVPKRAIKDLQEMADGYPEYFACIFRWASEHSGSFVLMANGGKRQEVQQVHFHLFTGHDVVRRYKADSTFSGPVFCDGVLEVLPYPDPNWEIHYIARPASDGVKDDAAYFQGVLHAINLLNRRCGIIEKGYSIVYQRDTFEPANGPVFHITAGRKLK